MAKLAKVVDEVKKTAKPKPESTGFLQLLISYRFLVAILTMLGIFCQYAAKLDLSANIVSIMDTSSFNKSQSSPIPSYKNWTALEKHNLLAAFFYGYIISEIPGGLMAQKYGSKLTMGLGIGLNSLCAWHYGIATEQSYAVMFILRVLVGIGSGVILPAASNIWTRWAPKQERSFLIALATSGAHLSPVVIFSMVAYLTNNSFTEPQWKSLFYVVAIMETIWLVLWFVLFADTPKQSKFIREKELTFIEQNLETLDDASHDLNIKWKALFSSKACLALFGCHACANWAFYTVLVEGPTFLNQVYKPTVEQSSLLSSLPYLMIWITSTSSSFLADNLLKREIVRSRTLIRKVAVGVGTIVPSAFLVGLGFAKTVEVATALISTALGFFGIAWGAGHMCNANDLAPVHAGVLFGISNTIATIPGIITPYVTAAITGHSETNSTPELAKSWQIVFSISAAFMFTAGIIYVIFGSAKAEEWDSDCKVDQHRASYISMQ